MCLGVCSWVLLSLSQIGFHLALTFYEISALPAVQLHVLHAPATHARDKNAYRKYVPRFRRFV